jgi:hypothetical protein
MEAIKVDMELKLEDIVALWEVIEWKLSDELIGKFQEELKNCKTKKEQEKFLEGTIHVGNDGVGEFPTLNFFPETYKDGEYFYGGFDLHDFIVFINEKVGSMDVLVK